MALACRPVRISSRDFPVPEGSAPGARSMTETEPSLAMKRTGSTRTSVPRPAGPVTLSASGRRPPQLLTYALPPASTTS